MANIYKVWVHVETIIHAGTPEEDYFEEVEPVNVGVFGNISEAETLAKEIENFTYLKGRR